MIIVAFIFSGCATFSLSYKLGTDAALSKNWDEAIRYFKKATRENPRNRVYQLSLLRAQLAASYDHLNKAREYASRGKREEALVEYKKALSYGQLRRDIQEEFRRFQEGEVEEEKPREVRIEPPVRLKVDAKKIVLKFPVEVSLRSIFQALAKHGQINIIFDEQFRDIPFAIEFVDMNFEQAINSLCLASKNFYRIVDEKTVIVAPDLPQKRAQYELNAIKTFYLSNVNAEEIRASFMQILRSQYRAPTLIVDKNLNSITVRDTPTVIELAEKMIRLWDKPKGEIIVDMEIMEVSRLRLKQLGLELQQTYLGVRYSGVEAVETPTWFNLDDLDISKAENFQISLPTAFMQFLESDSDTKIISQPRLRGLDGEEMTYLVGDKIPIPRTSFTPIAAGGFAQQPITNFTFEDVGIDVKITPRIHQEKEITLELEIKVKSIGGTGFANIPIIATREVKNTIRLKDGETNLLAGLLKDEERKIKSGIAGLKNIPILGGLFSSTQDTIQQTDVILTITPYIIRTIPLTEDDLRPLWVGLEGVPETGTAAGATPEERAAERGIIRRAESEDVAERRGQNQVFLVPPSINARLEQQREIRLTLNVRIQEEVSNMSLTLNFDPSVIKVKDVVSREFLNQLGEDALFMRDIDNPAGVCTIGFSSAEFWKGIRGTGTVATLIFEPVDRGESTVSISEASANSPAGQVVDLTTRASRIVVR